jgi:hypothetical protein
MMRRPGRPSRGDSMTPRCRAIACLFLTAAVAASSGTLTASQRGPTFDPSLVEADGSRPRRIFLEIRLAENEPVRGLTIEAKVRDSTTKTHVHYAVLASNGDVMHASVVPEGDRFNVALTLSAEGAGKVAEATAKHRGRPLAFVLDGDVVAVLTVRGPLKDGVVIPGRFTREEAMRISSGVIW